MALGIEIKVGLGVVLAGALGFLVLSDNDDSMIEYLYVDQVMEDPASYQGREIQVHGVVVEGSVQKKKETSGDYLFVIERNNKRLQIHYTDVVPDTFAEGGEVVLTGRLDGSSSRFEATVMTAKCPSKYEEDAMAAAEKEAERSGAKRS